MITCVGLCIHYHSQDTERFQRHRDPSCARYDHTSIFPPLPNFPLNPQPLATTYLSLISKILSFQNVNQRNQTVYTLLGLAVFNSLPLPNDSPELLPISHILQ